MNLSLDFSVVLSRWSMLADGARLTIELAVLATVCGFIIGTFCAIGRRSGVTAISRICGFYVEAIRNTPFLVQIFLVYFGLSSIGLSFSAFTVAVIALTINVGAYTAEICAQVLARSTKVSGKPANVWVFPKSKPIGTSRCVQPWSVSIRR